MATKRDQLRKRIRATIRIPQSLYQDVQGVVRDRGTEAVNINDFVVSAIRAYMRLLERRRIDAAFAGMAGDEEFQKEALSIANEFEASDWEALQLGDSGHAGA